MNQFQIEPFDQNLNHPNIGLKWKNWIDRFNNHLIDVDLEPIPAPANGQPNEAYIKRCKQIKARILSCIGPKTYDTYANLKEENDNFNTIIQKLTKHFSPKDHKRVRIANFRKIAQHMDEPVDKFVERLREAASGCEFSNVDDEIINQIIDKTASDALKTHLTLTENLDLKEVLRVGRALETLKTSTQNTTEEIRAPTHQPFMPCFEPHMFNM